MPASTRRRRRQQRSVGSSCTPDRPAAWLLVQTFRRQRPPAQSARSLAARSRLRSPACGALVPDPGAVRPRDQSSALGVGACFDGDSGTGDDFCPFERELCLPEVRWRPSAEPLTGAGRGAVVRLAGDQLCPRSGSSTTPSTVRRESSSLAPLRVSSLRPEAVLNRGERSSVDQRHEDPTTGQGAARRGGRRKRSTGPDLRRRPRVKDLPR